MPIRPQPEAFRAARRRLAELTDKLRHERHRAGGRARRRRSRCEREFAKADYLAAVRRAKEYIAAGDMMQVQIGAAADASATPSRRSACTARCAR